MDDFGSPELRLMQGLSQRVTALRPELLNAEASVGELAWIWAKDFETFGTFWRYRLWFEGDQVAAWGKVFLPYRIPQGDGKFREEKVANLTW